MAALIHPFPFEQQHQHIDVILNRCKRRNWSKSFRGDSTRHSETVERKKSELYSIRLLYSEIVKNFVGTKHKQTFESKWNRKIVAEQKTRHRQMWFFQCDVMTNVQTWNVILKSPTMLWRHASCRWHGMASDYVRRTYTTSTENEFVFDCIRIRLQTDEFRQRWTLIIAIRAILLIM